MNWRKTYSDNSCAEVKCGHMKDSYKENVVEKYYWPHESHNQPTTKVFWSLFVISSVMCQVKKGPQAAQQQELEAQVHLGFLH